MRVSEWREVWLFVFHFSRFKELLTVNRRLATVYLLKDDLKSLWDYRLPNWAMQFWREWRSRAMHSAIEPLTRFPRRLAEKPDG